MLSSERDTYRNTIIPQYVIMHMHTLKWSLPTHFTHFTYLGKRLDVRKSLGAQNTFFFCQLDFWENETCESQRKKTSIFVSSLSPEAHYWLHITTFVDNATQILIIWFRVSIHCASERRRGVGRLLKRFSFAFDCIRAWWKERENVLWNMNMHGLAG